MAAQAGDVEATKVLLAAGAILAPLAEVTDLLVAAEADPTFKDDIGWTFLHVAARNGDIEAIKVLLAAGADPDARTEGGSTPLHLAAEANTEPAIITALVVGGADVRARNADSWTPLHSAAGFNSVSGVLAALLEAGADPDARTEGGSTPLHLAAEANTEPAIITALVVGGADVRARDTDGWTPLHSAARFNSVSGVFAALLKAGVDLFAPSYQGETPFASAASFNENAAIVEDILEAYLSGYVANSIFAESSQLRKGLHRARCWFDDDAAYPKKSCFFMVVSEDPGAPDDHLVIFPVVKFSPRRNGPTENPFLHLGGGGPGNPIGLDDPHTIWLDLKDLVGSSNRDVYVIDPRGVGMAHPRLHCLEALAPAREALSKIMTAKEEIDVWQASHSTCKQRIELSQGRDLSQYNSRVVARDVELLRRALDIEKWVLLGYSYGTRYALTIARDFPDTVEAMVLNGAVFPNLSFVNQSAESIKHAFSRAFARCENTGTCVASLMEKRFWTLVSALDDEPLVIDELPSDIPLDESFVLTGTRLLDVVYMALYDSEFFPDIPDLVGELEHGWTRTLEEALRIYLNFYLDPAYSDAVLAGHYCSEEHPFVNYDLELRNAQTHRDRISELVSVNVYWSQTFCELWDVATAAPVEGEAIVTSIPVLFLQGALDPVVPIEYLGDQLQHFDHHAVLVFDDSSHWGGSMSGTCAMRRAGRFVEHKQLTGERCPGESNLPDTN